MVNYHHNPGGYVRKGALGAKGSPSLRVHHLQRLLSPHTHTYAHMWTHTTSGGIGVRVHHQPCKRSSGSSWFLPLQVRVDRMVRGARATAPAHAPATWNTQRALPEDLEQPARVGGVMAAALGWEGQCGCGGAGCLVTGAGEWGAGEMGGEGVEAPLAAACRLGSASVSGRQPPCILCLDFVRESALLPLPSPGIAHRGRRGSRGVGVGQVASIRRLSTALFARAGPSDPLAPAPLPPAPHPPLIALSQPHPRPIPVPATS